MEITCFVAHCFVGFFGGGGGGGGGGVGVVVLGVGVVVNFQMLNS